MKFDKTAKLKKSSILYLICFSALSIIQLLLIYGLFTAEPSITIKTDLYVDGTDFSPFLSLAQTGLDSIVQLVSIIVDIIFGALLSLIVMRILRRFTLRFSTIQTKKTGLIITLICGVVFFLFGCILMNFKPMLVYIPIPIVSFLSYHLGKQPQNK